MNKHRTVKSYQYQSDTINGIEKEYLDGDVIVYGFITTNGKTLEELLDNGVVTVFINDRKCTQGVGDLPGSLYSLVRMDLDDMFVQHVTDEQDFVNAEQ